MVVVAVVTVAEAVAEAVAVAVAAVGTGNNPEWFIKSQCVDVRLQQPSFLPVSSSPLVNELATEPSGPD